ncbi:unnamed protein product [Clonostachys rhizophaga]|uniref:Uncharacterized protein n=1 Tax=Clonostachys rhizophaga TaxID=160324 RepID=A0A9N9YK97_9HYPO|nr:unnamed protein product [Clonostachys rhizophaga]
MSFSNCSFPRQGDTEPAPVAGSGSETYPDSDSSPDDDVNSKWALVEEVRDKLGLVIPDIDYVKERVNKPEASRLYEEVRGKGLYKSWLKSSNSEKLLIYYQPGKTDALKGASPLSELCLRASYDFLNQGEQPREGKNQHRKNIVLLWYSSQHSGEPQQGYKSCDKSPWAMLGSLTSQLITACRDKDLPMKGLEKYNARAITRHLRNRLELFKMLVRQIPSGYKLACVIDDVCYFDQPELWHGANQVFEFLLSLDKDKEVKAKVSMFFTSTVKPKLVYDYFKEPDRTIIYEDI